MTERFTSRSFAGTSRKLVAVGTSSDFSMFSTIRAPTPRIGSPSGAEATVVGGAAGAATGFGALVAVVPFPFTAGRSTSSASPVRLTLGVVVPRPDGDGPGGR